MFCVYIAEKRVVQREMFRPLNQSMMALDFSVCISLIHGLVILIPFSFPLGDIPERSIFNQPELRAALLPYLVLTQAVRNGDLIQFGAAVEKYRAVFRADKNETLIQR